MGFLPHLLLHTFCFLNSPKEITGSTPSMLGEQKAPLSEEVPTFTAALFVKQG